MKWTVVLVVFCFFINACSTSLHFKNVNLRTPSSISTDLCLDILDSFLKHETSRNQISIEDFRFEASYAFLANLGHTTRLLRGKIVKVVIEDDRSEVSFVIQELKTNRLFKIRKNKILEIERLDPVTVMNEAISGKVNSVITLPIMMSIFSKLIFHPYKNLAKRESIEIVGGVLSSPKLGEEIASGLESFDKQFVQLGFRRPLATRIILNDAPILPSITGPFAVRYPVFNIWNMNAKKVIVLNPLLWNKKVIRDTSVLAHERMHAFLAQTYDESAFINKSQAFQEALADFGAAHFTGDPIIGRELLKNNTLSIRDISTREAGEKSINKLTDLTIIYHDNSLFVSNFLWRMRQEMGSEETSVVLKPIVDDLNAFRASYLALEKKEKVVTSTPTQQYINDLEYFMAVMKIRNQSNAFKDHVWSLVDESSSELSLNKSRIEKMVQTLKSDGKNHLHSGKSNLKQVLTLTGFGTAGIALELYALYEIFD
jgi:hypothetical protein